ncbi:MULTISPECIES: winged helix-turn-helix transcriptional regulator [Archangium]|uniref:Helix-turn-helix domain-containing protein n=1 Tax=Archangium lansingense TaxID=2995310 RepID=A0ABT4A3S4_9BACT|nr:helix-turn-helix domain-containing protein [Archangium lansinium]MCY1076308.1 helix-turn-helix domain-containing protein [Archangium lansinium]WPB82133.1 helix-turn-helix domain-containing protein [Archangium gephyra]
MKPQDRYLPPEVCREVGSVLECIGDKWTILVMRTLDGGSLRFSELRRSISGVSQKMLTATLRALERDGFVTRTVTPTVPARVDYTMTDLGREVMVPINALATWALRNQHRVSAARRSYDAKSARGK